LFVGGATAAVPGGGDNDLLVTATLGAATGGGLLDFGTLTYWP